MDAPLRIRTSALRAQLGWIAAALAARWLSYAFMTALALWNETRPAPPLPDALISSVPFVPWVARVNYIAWLVLYLPLAVIFLLTEPRRWVRYMFTGALVSVLRGVCIALTGMGPPDRLHAGHGIGSHPWLEVYTDLLSPLGVFSRGSAHAYLTKDLFFSGHTSTTFLLLLYLWPRRELRIPALLAHIVVVVTVVFAHLHYAIDIVGAWGITFAVFASREWGPRAPLQREPNVAKIRAGDPP